MNWKDIAILALLFLFCINNYVIVFIDVTYTFGMFLVWINWIIGCLVGMHAINKEYNIL